MNAPLGAMMSVTLEDFWPTCTGDVHVGNVAPRANYWAEQHDGCKEGFLCAGCMKIWRNWDGYPVACGICLHLCPSFEQFITRAVPL